MLGDVARARASMTSVSVLFSCAAAPFTTLARLGIRFARSWNAAWTSAHFALAFSSAVGTLLIPHPANEAAATGTRRNFKKFLCI